MKKINRRIKFFFLFLPIFFIPFNSRADYGVIADVHAGNEKVRTNNATDIVYPSKALGAFQKAINAMKGKVDFVLVLGDNVNKPTYLSYARKLKKVADGSGLRIIWAKGNHDGDSFQIFSNQNYYYEDVDGHRIIVLDTNNQDSAIAGSLDDTQEAWLESVIQENSIVVQHHPVFDRNLNVLPQYQKEYDLINQTHSKFYSGHWHIAWRKGNFEGIPALTLRGSFIRSFNNSLPDLLPVSLAKNPKAFTSSISSRLPKP